MRRLAWLCLLSSVLLAPRSRAIVVHLDASITFAPRPLAKAPRNAHVFVRTGWPITPKGDPETPWSWFELRTAATSSAAPATIGVDLRFVEQPADPGAIRSVELIPRALLAPGTRYELVDVRREAGRTVVGTFVTGTAVDAKKPEWKGIVGSNTTASRFGKITSAEVELDVDPAKDDSEVLYAIWTGLGGAPLDYAKPPRAIERLAPSLDPKSTPHQLLVGEPFGMVVAKLPFAKDVRIGVRPVDVAGNLGDPSEVVVDTTKVVVLKPEDFGAY